MKNTLLLFGLFVSLAPNLFAQTENTAPIVWERYRHSDLGVSVDLPKLPTVIDNYDMCSEELTRKGYAYAEGAVYEFVVVARKSPPRRPPNCTSSKSTFDQSTIDRRLNQLRESKGVVETKTQTAGLDAFQFKQDRTVRLFIPDIEHERLVELAITHYPNETPDTDRYFGSLQFNAGSGKEIGEGSKVTLGDPVAKTVSSEPPAAPVATEKPAAPSSEKFADLVSVPADRTGVKAVPSDDLKIVPLQILAKPHARYTDAARKSNVQGTVRLKATLLASGSVGTVTPVTTLEDGLTEQAISAARRLVFLPPRVNGIPVSKTITIEYSFSIY